MSASKKVLDSVRILIDLSEETEIRYWTKHFRVCSAELQKAIDKVGNFAPAVRKQLTISQ